MEVSIYVFCGTLAAKVNLRSAVSSGEKPFWPDGFESRKIDVDKVLECYRRYIEFVVEKQPTYKQFVQNMELKMHDPEFSGRYGYPIARGHESIQAARGIPACERTIY